MRELTSEDPAPASDAAPDRPRRARLLPVHLGILSAAAGAIHLAVATEHFRFWWLHGAFFLAAGLAQVAWGGIVLAAPRRWLFRAAAAGNGVIVLAWILSRTAGVPIGPGAGIAEPVGVADTLATAFEVVIVAGALAWARRVDGDPLRRPSLRSLAVFGGAVVALASWGIVDQAAGEGGHAHGRGDVASGGHHHSGSPIADDDPLLLEIQRTIDGGGTRAGMDLLERRVTERPDLRGMSHQYVHALGRYVYETSESPSTAFGSCDDRFEGGCYHGVLQGYFEDNPDFTGGDVAGLCGDLGAEAGLDLEWQCLHGLGHGLTLFFAHEVHRPLEYCDYLGSSWDRRSCYGGVFMENVIWGQALRGGQETVPGAAAPSDDPQYPCNEVDEVYRWDCWLMQSSTILDLVGWDFEAAFAECARAPAAYVPTCHESMGRDIAGYTLHEVERAAELCLLSDETWVANCFAGAARQMVDWYAEAGPAFRLCSAAPPGREGPCHAAVAQTMDFYWRGEPDRLRSECAKAGEPRWVELCEQTSGARAG